MTTMTQTTRYGYKVLDAQGGAIHSKCKWHLPQGREPGQWMKPIENIVLCVRGYHFCRDTADLLEWLNETIWIVEVCGTVLEGDDKAIASEARLIRKVDTWDERTARLFACACVKRALKYADAGAVKVLRNTIKVAEKFANGKATEAELGAARAAAKDAAWGAAGDAAWTAAGSAAWAAARAAAWTAARNATRAAAKDAAKDAAWAAAGAAAGAAEKKWQARELAQLLNVPAQP